MIEHIPTRLPTCIPIDDFYVNKPKLGRKLSVYTPRDIELEIFEYSF